MALVVNLEKSAQALVLSLEKAGITQPPILEVGFGLDVSKSFEDEHRSGITDVLLTRLVPWGLAFDPDKKLDCFTFSDGPAHVCDVGPVDASNYQGFIPRKVVNKVIGWNGGTDYSYLLEKMLTHFGWRQPEQPGFIKRLFGAKPVETVEKRRSLIIVATDGDNYDPDRTRMVLEESQARKDEVYFLFLGISNQKVKFEFLRSIGDVFDNTGFVRIEDLHGFVEKSDEELNELLITDELLSWLKR
ncbi:uncharacterized protein NMK_1839 [Novimethylophilus kurashikiensis]|uniref:VWFA domain-containing protein n=1 Tax=Novimethylophilus kurashikiensis TaxID=1825523 RepID=A0A2R5FBJ2_9PROT|nr:VWA domain-containing protein [Novimethylophilus kurashikiensis]GBG14273.1 uncharacterized protein NMK_1839 [Novimethylophilus kurashikiensis]